MAYGLVPIQGGPGGYSAGGFEEYRITDAEDIFNGDIVVMADDGGISRVANGTALPSAAAPALGVFVGCRYVSNSGTPTWGQYWDFSNSASDAYGFVVTNPYATYKIQGVHATAAVWSDALTGELINPTIAAGNTSTGNGGSYIDLDDTGDANDALRVVDLLRNGQSPGTASTTWNIVVQFNALTNLRNTGVTY